MENIQSFILHTNLYKIEPEVLFLPTGVCLLTLHIFAVFPLARFHKTSFIVRVLFCVWLTSIGGHQDHKENYVLFSCQNESYIICILPENQPPNQTLCRTVFSLSIVPRFINNQPVLPNFHLELSSDGIKRVQFIQCFKSWLEQYTVRRHTK